jgi:hypothetical protein
MKKHHGLFFGLACILGIMLVFSFGCGGGDSKNPADSGDPGTGDPNIGDPGAVWSNSVQFLSASQQKILADAEKTFYTLIKTSTRAAAREELVKQLKSTAGVKEAVLFKDGYTVCASFSDSTRGIINTIDYTELSKGINSIDYGTVKTIPKIGRTVSVPVGKRMADDPIAPAKRKVLFLDIIEPDVPCVANIERLKTLFLSYGWEQSDLVVKTRSGRTDQSVTPEDMFRLGEYGVVVIYTHCAYGKVPGTGEFPYIKVGSAPSKTDPNAEKYRDWYEQGQVLPSSDGLYIRFDRLTTELDKMPNSIVYLCTNFGWQARSSFLSRSCGAVLAWDDVFSFADAFHGMLTLFTRMGGNTPATNVSSAFEDQQITKTRANSAGRTAKLQLQSNKSNLYLPAWAEVSVIPSSLPEETQKVEVGVQWQSKNLGGTVIDALNAGTAYDLFPGTLVFTGKALKGDEIITKATKTVSLHAGKNAVSLSFSWMKAQKKFMAYTFNSTSWEGRICTLYLSYYIWTAVPGVEKYSVPSGLMVPRTLSRYHYGDWSIVNLYFTLDDVIKKFGSNIVGVQSDEVVYIVEHGGYYDYKPDDKETLDAIQSAVENSKKDPEEYITIYPIYPELY